MGVRELFLDKAKLSEPILESLEGLGLTVFPRILQEETIYSLSGWLLSMQTRFRMQK
jgi:hypothetical protein